MLSPANYVLQNFYDARINIESAFARLYKQQFSDYKSFAQIARIIISPLIE